MLNVLLHGVVTVSPAAAVDKNGHECVVAQVRAEDKDGKAFTASAIAYSKRNAAALLQLGAGESVAIAGRAALSRFEGVAGLSVTVGRVLSLADADAVPARRAGPEVAVSCASEAGTGSGTAT